MRLHRHFNTFSIPQSDDVTVNVMACGKQVKVTTVEGKRYASESMLYTQDAALVSCKGCLKHYNMQS